jgi:hypothetical protein
MGMSLVLQFAKNKILNNLSFKYNIKTQQFAYIRMDITAHGNPAINGKTLNFDCGATISYR